MRNATVKRDLESWDGMTAVGYTYKWKIRNNIEWSSPLKQLRIVTMTETTLA
jgi:hypothetical protein